MKNYIKLINSVLIIILVSTCLIISCQQEKEYPGFRDESHFSDVFNKHRTYRLYLPARYYQSEKPLPVIYFFHGWGGRYFKDDNAKLEYCKIQKLVDKYKVILVMWDGNMDLTEPRPYNIGVESHVKYQVQMKDYFLELISHIDTTYNTINNRSSRGIIGYSMGGFMSYFIAGKYPHLISAAVNLTGSVGFNIGYPENSTLYPLRHTFENLRDVKLRFHNSSEGELSDLNREVHKGALYDGNLDYEYWEFEGGHKVDEPGETKVFEKAMKFVANAFDYPQKRKNSWSHYDLYKDFDIWGYSVKSDKKEPGFIYLHDVSPQGFGLYTHKWLPNGAPLKDVQSEVKTAPLYNPGDEYQVKQYDKQNDTFSSSTVTADSLGSLNFQLPGTGSKIGIYKSGRNPKLTFIDYSINSNKHLIRVGEKNLINIQIANLGDELDATKEISFELSSNEQTLSIDNSKGKFYHKETNGKIALPPITAYCKKPPTKDGGPATIKFELKMNYSSLEFIEEFDVPVFFDVPEFQNILIDDGRLVKDTIFGSGNGDGIISPGEQVMVYTGEYRTQLFYDDPYIVIDQEKLYAEVLPAKWTGDGVTQSSIIKISENCPDGHVVELLAKYETKDYMPIKRHVFWGKVSVKIN